MTKNDTVLVYKYNLNNDKDLTWAQRRFAHIQVQGLAPTRMM